MHSGCTVAATLGRCHCGCACTVFVTVASSTGSASAAAPSASPTVANPWQCPSDGLHGGYAVAHWHSGSLWCTVQCLLVAAGSAYHCGCISQCLWGGCLGQGTHCGLTVCVTVVIRYSPTVWLYAHNVFGCVRVGQCRSRWLHSDSVSHVAALSWCARWTALYSVSQWVLSHSGVAGTSVHSGCHCAFRSQCFDCGCSLPVVSHRG